MRDQMAPSIPSAGTEEVRVGAELKRVVDYVNANSKGLPAVDLARLNLRIGKPISRSAMTLADQPELVERAWKYAMEILSENRGDR